LGDGSVSVFEINKILISVCGTLFKKIVFAAFGTPLPLLMLFRSVLFNLFRYGALLKMF